MHELEGTAHESQWGKNIDAFGTADAGREARCINRFSSNPIRWDDNVCLSWRLIRMI
jgi:hypothetical protein